MFQLNKDFYKDFDQDTKDKIQNSISMGTMFVKILMASFPMMFVPQQCGNEPCSMTDKLFNWGWLSLVNGITFASFIRLYYVQGKREHFLIEFLDEDDTVAENELNEQIIKYPIIHKNLLQLNKDIEISNIICISTFVINTIYSSCFILIQRYLDSTTVTVLLTNSLLVQGKLMQIRESYIGDDLGVSTVSTSPRIYNVIDTDYTIPSTENEVLKLVLENTIKSLGNNKKEDESKVKLKEVELDNTEIKKDTTENTLTELKEA